MSVPYAAGGPLDTLARIMAERMRAILGATIVIENIGGAGGSIGVGRVVRAAPDGYTIGAGTWGSHVANVAHRALERNDALVQQWLKREYPRIRALAQRENAD